MDESQEQVNIHIDDSTEPLATADDRDEGPNHPDDPNLGNPDVDAGDDYPDQRPFTDNRAGG